MKSGEWSAWLQSWLKRHPLRRPPEGFEREFPQVVMARIRTEQAPVRDRGSRTLRWTLEPRWGLAWSGALAAALVAGILILPARLVDHSAAPPLEGVVQEAQLLLEADEVAYLAEVDLEGELQDDDRLVLAEAAASAPSSAELVNDLELLDLLEEETDPGEADRVTDEELLEELQGMDEAEMAVT